VSDDDNVVRLDITDIGPVTPLDAQFGLIQKQNVPPGLRNPLFGQPADAPYLRTYAILDAAKIANLPLRLETAGLDHACLFQGKALQDLGNAGPWIVSLRDDNSFTRALFTASGTTNPPGSLWDQEPGIYIRSALPIDTLRQHFRKFTRIPDDAGKWYLFRFWEAAYLADFLQNSPPSTLAHFFMDGQIAAIYAIADRAMVCLALGSGATAGTPKARITVTPQMLAAFALTAEKTFRRRLCQDVQRDSTLTRPQFDAIYAEISAAGFTMRGPVRRLVTWIVKRFPRNDRPDWVARSLVASRSMPEDVRVARLLNDDPEGENHAG
jgi:hypothetical protein